jgi:methionine salvage enolase-phosphatase E1
MKKLLLGALLLLSTLTFSQALEKSAYYKSDLTIYSGGSSQDYTMYFQVTSSGDVKMLESKYGSTYAFKASNTSSNNHTTVYTWLNNGGIWSESQTFVFTKDDETGNIDLLTMRVVKNEGKGPWQTYGIGIVEKL